MSGPWTRLDWTLLSCLISLTLLQFWVVFRLDTVVLKGGARPNLIWDLTNNISYSCWKGGDYSGVLPCLLRGHRYWSVAHARPVSGLELLRGQGFVGKITTEGTIHGKTFLVPVSCFLRITITVLLSVTICHMTLDIFFGFCPVS